MAVAVHLQLDHALADVLEEAAARVLPGERVQGRVHRQTPHLNIAVRRARHKVLLVRIDGQAFDRVVVGLQERIYSPLVTLFFLILILSSFLPGIGGAAAFAGHRICTLLPSCPPI